MFERSNILENPQRTAEVTIFRSSNWEHPIGLTKMEIQRKVTNKCLISILNKSAQIVHAPSGAPYVEGDENLQISISHSNEWYAIYLSSEHPVGVDIQTIKKNIYKGRSYFVNEFEENNFSMDAKNLHLIWSAKEAVYKLKKGEVMDYKESITVKGITDKNITVMIDEEQIECSYVFSSDYSLVFTN
jgi:phosphopantetheinyl transferase (holo-ACP synthase)